MKKTLCIILILTITAAIAGCGSDTDTSKRGGNQTSTVNDVIEAGISAADAESSASSQSSVVEANTADDRQSDVNANAPTPEVNDDTDVVLSTTEGIDIDLVSLSSTFVYSEVYNMLCSPQDYIGKVIRMKGKYTYFHDEASGNYYFACIIKDATECCSQGIEFVLTDEYSYPDDYPEIGDEITVVGEYETYMEGEHMYCTLKNAILE